MIKNTITTTIIATSIAATAQAGLVADSIDPVSPPTSYSLPALPSFGSELLLPAGTLQFDLAVGAHTEYIFRGIDQGGNQLLDVSLTATQAFDGFNLYANAWYGTTGSNGLDELDITLGWEKDFGSVSVSAGAIYFGFSDDNGGDLTDTVELFVSASKDLYAGINGSLIYYKDINNFSNNNGYAEVALSKDFTVKYLNPTVSALVAFDAENVDFSHYQLSLSTSYQLTENSSLSPYVTWQLADSAPSNEVYGGITLSVSF